MSDGTSRRVLFWSSATSLTLHLLAGGMAVIALPGAQALPAGSAQDQIEAPMLWVEPLPLPAISPPPPPPEATPPKPVEQPPPVVEPPKPPEVQLGVDDAEKPSPTWIGSKRPGEHAAHLSTVEQPALTREAPGGGSPGTPAEAKPSPPSLPSATPAPMDEPPVPPAPPEPEEKSVAEEEPFAVMNAAQPPPALSAAKPPELAPGAGAGGTPDPRGTSEQPFEAIEASRQDTQRQEGLEIEPQARAQEGGVKRADPVEELIPPTDLKLDIAKAQEFMREFLNRLAELRSPPAFPHPPRPSPARPGAMGLGDARVDPDAVPSPKVSDATSTRRSAKYSNGAVDAGRGLELIVTQRPDSTTYTRLRGATRNPTFDIILDRQGVPKKVVAVRSSGNDTLDFDIVNAIHAWRAKGKDLQELPDRADAALTVRLTFLIFDE